jgi:hypothetical protein
VSERRFRRLLLLAGAVGALHALVYAPVVAARVKDSDVYVAAAKALLHGSYTTPLRVTNLYADDGAVADLTNRPLPRAAWDAPERQTVRTPGYPLFLAALGGGDGRISEALVVLAQALLLGGASILLGLAFRPLAGERAALLGAWLYALDPWSRHHAALVLTETLAAFLVAVLVLAFVRAWRSPSLARWLAAGAVAGAATLVRPVLSLSVILVGLAALARPGSPRQRFVAGAAVGLAAFVVLGPWLAWTRSVVGRPVLTSLSQGTSMLFATYGDGPGDAYRRIVADPAYQRDADAPHRFAPTTRELLRDPTAHPRYLLRADDEYRRLARQRYRERLSDDPVGTAADYGYRFWTLFQAQRDWGELEVRLPEPLRVATRAVNVVAVLLAAVGAVLLARRRGAALAIVLYVGVFAAASAVFHVEARYGMPLRGVVLCFAGVAVASLAARRRATVGAP